MYHKVIRIADHRVRVHSIDGRTWTAQSRRHAAQEQLAYNERKRNVYHSDGQYLDSSIPDDLEVFPCDLNS
ncbi:MAG TPA: hypothetical protein VIY48_02935 [Candidatus Paceibacterota bacterium]